jgi:hypothetical protein
VRSGHLPAALLLAACASAPAPPVVPPMERTPPPNPRSMPHHTLESVKDSVVGPTDPALRALQGQKPLVHVRHDPECEFILADEAQVPCPTRAGFELAVFQDGTLAFDGGTCARADDLVIRQLTARQLTALHATIDRIFPKIAEMQMSSCSHGDRLQISCRTNRRQASVAVGCSEQDAYRLALQVIEHAAVVDLLGTPEEQEACAAGRKYQISDEIRLTISPQQVRKWIYQPNP